jgi:tRNA pseudouridine65 synthase
VLLFALDEESLRATQEEFARQACDKIYQAVVRGWTDESGTIEYDLKSEEAPQKSQASQTRYRTLARSELPKPAGPYPTARFSRVALNPTQRWLSI